MACVCFRLEGSQRLHYLTQQQLDQAPQSALALEALASSNAQPGIIELSQQVWPCLGLSQEGDDCVLQVP